MYALSLDSIKRQYYAALNKSKEIKRLSLTSCFDLNELIADKNRSIKNDLKLKLVKRQLLKSIRNGDFYPVYQPLYNCLSGDIYGAEVLSRISAVNNKKIPPITFIPLIERTNLMGLFGDWVLERSINDLGKWREDGLVDKDFLLSVNVSATQLEDGDFYGRLVAYIEENNLHARNIQLEITETKKLKHLDVVNKQITRIKRAGITIALDDFGTGYSNIIYLNKFNIDCLKIDKEFLLKTKRSEKQETVIHSMVLMANKLKINIICEGVETYEQRSFLESIGCYCHQGKLVSMPVSEKEFLSQYKEYQANC